MCKGQIDVLKNEKESAKGLIEKKRRLMQLETYNKTKLQLIFEPY
jgi:hypothetical protein